jgi:hypothetical protein
MLAEFSLGLKTILGASALGFAEAAGQAKGGERLSERDRPPRILSATIDGSSKPFAVGDMSALKAITFTVRIAYPCGAVRAS